MKILLLVFILSISCARGVDLQIVKMERCVAGGFLESSTCTATLSDGMRVRVNARWTVGEYLPMSRLLKENK